MDKSGSNGERDKAETFVLLNQIGGLCSSQSFGLLLLRVDFN